MNNTVIDWFLPWPPQALQAVAHSFLGMFLHIYFLNEFIPGGKKTSVCASAAAPTIRLLIGRRRREGFVSITFTF